MVFCSHLGRNTCAEDCLGWAIWQITFEPLAALRQGLGVRDDQFDVIFIAGIINQIMLYGQRSLATDLNLIFYKGITMR